jgi:hypothetical protein
MIETAARALVWGFSFGAGLMLFVLVLACALAGYEAARIQWDRRAERRRAIERVIAAIQAPEQEPWR